MYAADKLWQNPKRDQFTLQRHEQTVGADFTENLQRENVNTKLLHTQTRTNHAKFKFQIVLLASESLLKNYQ